MRVCDILESEKDGVIANWAAEARALPSTRELTRLALLDHMPALLSDLIRWLRSDAEVDALRFDSDAIRHAFDRLAHDVSLQDVVDEYRVLRIVIERRVLVANSKDIPDLVRINAAIDKAIAVAVEHYTRRRDAEWSEQATRSRLALAASRLGTWDWRPIDRKSVWDEPMRTIFAQPAAGALDEERFLEVVHPADRAAFVAAAQQRLRDEDDFEIEYRVVVGAQEKWLRSVGSVVERDADGRAARVIGTTADISESKRSRILEALAKRKLEAIADLGDESLRSQTVDALLPRLLEICLTRCPDVDTAAILLLEGDLLRVKAATGIHAQHEYAIPVGEGFAGTIAATRKPLLLSDAAHSELPIGPWVHELGIRALYGVPLINGEQLIGVAHIGSRERSDFPDDVKQLFALIADRAASAIAQRELRDELVRRNAELEAIVSAVPDGLFVVHGESLVYANPASAQLLGAADAASLLGPLARLRDLVNARRPGDDASVPHDELPISRALRGERALDRVVVSKVDGRHDVHARIAAAPIVVGGSTVGAVAIAADVTALVELERQRDALMHAVVHDLRNPLSSIVTIAQLVSRKVERDFSDDWAVDRLRKLETNALRLDRLLKDLLDVALAKGGRLTMAKTRVSIGDVLREQAVIWSAASNRHTIQASGCAVEVLADRDRLTQVLDNLLSNAIKYSPKGGNVDIRCETSPRQGEVRVTVRDQGLGVPIEERHRIFEPYARGAVPPEAVGHGLGLFITAEIVRQHGGQIGVESEPGSGSVFWFTLPLAEADGEARED